jgi:hypothetical protein
MSFCKWPQRVQTLTDHSSLFAPARQSGDARALSAGRPQVTLVASLAQEAGKFVGRHHSDDKAEKVFKP